VCIIIINKNKQINNTKEKTMKEETKVISKSNKNKTQMVVVQTTVTGKKNRKGEPLKTSVTKHIKYNPSKKELNNE